MRRATLQTTASKGELDPDLSERIDLEHLYNSLASAPNTLFHPQGGFSDRGGFELCSDADVLAAGHKRRLRRRVVPVALTAGMVTAANGGTVANVVDQSAATVFTTGVVNSVSFTILEVDFGAPTRVDFFDLLDFYASALGADEAIAVDYWDGAVWRRFGDAVGVPTAKHIRTTARSRRFGVSPGGTVTARQWRVVAVDSVGIGTVTIGRIRVWQGTDGLSPVRIREVARDGATTHQLVLTERNIDVFVGGAYRASIMVPIAAQQVRECTFGGGFDTMLIFHEMIETLRIERQGSSSEWHVGVAPYANVPALVSNVRFSGDQDEVQEIDLDGIQAGTAFALFMGDAHALLTYTTDAQALIDIKAALQSLPGVATAAADLVVTLSGSRKVRMRFSGSNGNRAWPLVSAIPVGAVAVEPMTTIVQPGLLSTGLYFEARTGWPRAGTFVQSRLLVVGFRGAPTSYRFSNNPNVWSFQTGTPVTADMSFGGTLDVDEIEVIFDCFMGQHIHLFTQAGEWWAETRTLDATQPINIVRASSQGIERGTRLTFTEGSTLFIQQGGRTIRDFAYDFSNATYRSDALSVFAPHLTTGVIDLAMRQARSVSEGNLLLLVNADGSMVGMTLLRAQQVIAGSPWRTDGAFRAVMSDVAFDVWAAIERSGDLWLERWTPGIPLDWSTRVTRSPASPTVSGLSYLDGRDDVWAYADGDVYGPLAVAGGVLTLPVAASDVRVGLEPEWHARGQVIRNKLANGDPMRLPARIYEVELSLRDTGDMAIATSGGAASRVPLVRGDGRNSEGGPLQTEYTGAPLLSLLSRLYTGDIRVGGLLGVSKHPYFELSRAVPAPVTVKAVRIELATAGEER